jgi:AraC-like DNA-binding protein
MGQQLLSDFESIDCLVVQIALWGKTLISWRDLTQRPDRLSIEGERFCAELSLGLDRDKQDGTLAIEIRLKRRGPGRHRGRFLLVSWGQTVRRLDYARQWRIVAGKVEGTRRHRRLLDSCHLSREIYWTPAIAAEDLRAQVVMSLAQLGCIPPILARDLLRSYIDQKFRFGISGLSPIEREQAREAISFLAADEVLNHWFFPEDCRAFRKYVRTRVKLARRQYLRGCDSGRNSNEYHGRDRSYDEREEKMEPSWDPRINDAEPCQSSLPRPEPIRPEIAEEMPIADAAEHLHVSPSYLYKLIRDGRLPRIFKKSTQVLPRKDVERVRDALAQRKGLREQRENMELSGRTASAARKAAYRAFGPMPRT